MNDLQPKIDKWWAGLTPEDREEWWSEGDKASRDNILIGAVGFVKEHPRGRRLCFYPRWLDEYPTEDFTPAPCAQLWWKLEAWLGIYIIKYDGVIWSYKKRVTEKSIGAVTRSMGYDEDRRHALLDACLAVQRGEG